MDGDITGVDEWVTVGGLRSHQRQLFAAGVRHPALVALLDVTRSVSARRSLATLVARSQSRSWRAAMHDDARWGDGRERDGGGPERDVGGRGGIGDARRRDDDPRDVFRRDLDLPDNREWVRVQHRYRSCRLNGDEVRALSTIGAFRVIAEEDLARPAAEQPDTREDDGRIDRLRGAGLVETVAIDGGDQRAVALTSEGRELLELSRLDRDGEPRQAFHARPCRPRERSHDMQVYPPSPQSGFGGTSPEVSAVAEMVLDHDRKREYQQLLQEPNRDDA